MDVLSLYNCCLQKVSHLLNEGTLTENQEDSPFKGFPSKIILDLFTSHMSFEARDSFTELRFKGLEYLMKSKTLPELRLQGNLAIVRRYFSRLLVSLASGCQNLQIIKLTNLTNKSVPGISQALENVLRNSFNLKIINCEIHFDLKALRNCKHLKSVILGFTPMQPWYDFLDETDGCVNNLDSLVVFTILDMSHETMIELETTDDIVTLLRHCPNLASLGNLNSTSALAHLYQTGSPHHVNLEHCVWSDRENMEKNLNDDKKENLNKRTNAELIRKAVNYHSSVKELALAVTSIKSIPYLRNLRNLTFLYVYLFVKRDYSLKLCNVFKFIGVKLMYLGFWFATPMDFTQLLQHSPDLEALSITVNTCIDRFETDINLPKLKYLSILYFKNNPQPLARFSNCHNLIELYMDGYIFDDEALDEFLLRNSLSKLKTAGLMSCQLSVEGICKLLRNAPELQDLQSYDNSVIRRMQVALRKTNHNARCNRRPYKTTCVFDRWFEQFK